jgi:hypothetical protein
MNRQEQIDYCEYIINNNPLDKVFPITTRSSHGFDFNVWIEASAKSGLTAKVMPYKHKTYSREGHKTEVRQQVALI